MTTQQIPDLRPLLLGSLEVADSLVAALTVDDTPLPTPCSEYDVLALTDHLVMVARRVRIVLTGRHFTEAVPTGASDLDELRTAWASSAADLRAAAPDFDLARTVTAPFGTVPASRALGMYCGELTVHSWDLAVATGHTDLLDPALAEPLVASARVGIPEERDGFPFAPVVAVPDDAPAYDRLVGWYGRDPQWAADGR